MSSLWKYIIILFAIMGCNQNSKRSIPVYSPSDKELVITLLPYKGFDTTLIPLIQSEVEQFYGCKTIILKKISLPIVAFYASRDRYKADSILSFENKLAINDQIIVGLTNSDISTSKGAISDWGILGLGDCPGNACVISTYRINKASANEQQFQTRLIKIILHEIGHNFGLPHCTNDPRCLMNDADGSITTVDKENKWLCNSCKHKIGL